MRGGGGSEEMRKGVKVIALPLSLTVIAIALIAVSSASTLSLKYTIDGNLSDWGVNLTGDWSLNETWVPNESIEFVVEDNNDPHHVRYAAGVHIKGVGSNYEYYDEPLVYCSHYGRYMVEPIGDEPYDIEAKYLDEDENYIYVAIVTSMNPNGSGNLEPIDFAMNLDGNDSTGEYGYEYGVKLHTSDGIPQWDIYYLPNWSEPHYCPENRPGKMVGVLPGGNKTGTAIGKYVQCPSCNLGESCTFSGNSYTGCDHGVPNYVIEMAIPKSAVNMTGKNLTEPPFPKALWTCDTCGNDKISNPIPEFLTVVIPAAALICFVFFIHWRRWGGGK